MNPWKNNPHNFERFHVRPTKTRMVYTDWVCAQCGQSDLTRVQQTSKCHGVGRCYWCGPKTPVKREPILTQEESQRR